MVNTFGSPAAFTVIQAQNFKDSANVGSSETSRWQYALLPLLAQLRRQMRVSKHVSNARAYACSR